MRMQEFVEPYPRELPVDRGGPGDPTAFLRPAREWSQAYGRTLHDYLSGNAEVPMVDHDDHYLTWAESGRLAITQQVETLPLKQRRDAQNEMHFHTVNLGMLSSWGALRRDEEYLKQRSTWITIHQDMLAYTGLTLYAQRDALVKNMGEHALFDNEEVKLWNRTMTGAIHEIDTAIVLMDIMRRHRNLLVVAGPQQFERTRDVGRNVDFVVIDTAEDRAVGVQAKAKLWQEDYAKADHSRVVFVDGDADFNSVNLVRPQRTSSRTKVVSWPGIIAAKRMHSLKAHNGMRFATHSAKNPRAILNAKFMASRLVGHLKVDSQRLTTLIGDRIMEKL